MAQIIDSAVTNVPAMCLVAQSCLTLQSHRLQPARPLSSWDSPGKNTGVGCHALLQGIFPTLGSNPVLLHCRWILNHLSYQEISRILEWVAYPFWRGSSWPGNWTRVCRIAGTFFTCWTKMVSYRLLKSHLMLYDKAIIIFYNNSYFSNFISFGILSVI